MNALWQRSCISALAVAVVCVLVPGTLWAQDGTISGTVSNAAGDGIGGATVLVAETGDSVTTGADGSYSVQVAAGSYTMIATADGYDNGEQQATVAAGGSATADFSLTESVMNVQDTVVVLGSRVERTALETPVPVDVLPVEEMTQTGMTETSKMIQFLAPSFNHQTSTISDGSDIVRPSTLRSLGPDQTLVLVNGKRRHNSALVHVNGSIGRGTAGVDLNAIPASAIERVEILRDGAAAQYGSDAIAGVINVVLKDTTDKTNITLNAGEHFEGDGQVLQAAVNHGFNVGDGGFFNITAEYRDRDWTNRAGMDPRRIFNFLEQELGQPALDDGTLDPREDTYNRINHRYGDAASENLYLFLNSEIPINDTTDFYFFGGIAERDGESAGFNRLPSQSRTNIFIHPEGHLPRINTTVDDTSFSLGVRKNWAEWAMDASLTYGMNEFNFFISNSANTSFGPDSPTSADAGTLNFDQTTFNLDFYGTVGSGTPINVAFGFEYREDGYEIEAGENVSWADGGFPNQFGGDSPAGIQVFPGFQPQNAVDANRDNIAIYGDIEFDVGENFLLGIAARFEDYSDFGNSVTGKVTGRYEFSPSFALRGSASTGFRAPSLHQSNLSNISTQFVDVGGVLTPVEVGTFPVASDAAMALGATPLEEETSVSYTIGFTSQPNSNLSISADVFSIDIDDRIVLTGRFDASNPQIAPLLDPLGVGAAQFFSNAIDTETQGVDLVISWAKRLANDATLSLTAAGNWNSTEITDIRTPPELTGLEATLFPFIDQVYVERGQPKQLYNLAGRYSKGPWSGMLRFNYFGAVSSTESNTDPARLQKFGGEWLTDLDVSYSFDNGITVAIGGNNIFDVFPDENIPSNSFNGIFPYPRRVAPFGFNGGYYYLRLSIDI